jgi:hypothetical protein
MRSKLDHAHKIYSVVPGNGKQELEYQFSLIFYDEKSQLLRKVKKFIGSTCIQVLVLTLTFYYTCFIGYPLPISLFVHQFFLFFDKF